MKKTSLFCSAAGATLGSPMKSIGIRLPNVETTKLAEIAKVWTKYRELQSLIRELFRIEHHNLGSR